jgi:hypothetical protein
LVPVRVAANRVQEFASVGDGVFLFYKYLRRTDGGSYGFVDGTLLTSDAFGRFVDRLDEDGSLQGFRSIATE